MSLDITAFCKCLRLAFENDEQRMLALKDAIKQKVISSNNTQKFAVCLKLTEVFKTDFCKRQVFAQLLPYMFPDGATKENKMHITWQELLQYIPLWMNPTYGVQSLPFFKIVDFPEPLTLESVAEFLDAVPWVINGENARLRCAAFDFLMQQHAGQVELKMQQKNSCIICCDKPIECVLVPCGHAYVCTACAEHPPLSGIGKKRLRDNVKCAICRQAVFRVMRLFLASS